MNQNDKKKRKWYLLLIPLILYVISWKILGAVFDYEYEAAISGMAASDQVGFPIPLMTVFLFLIFTVICIIVTIVCLILFFRKPKPSPGLLLMRCPNCGNQIPENASFCTFCGTRL